MTTHAFDLAAALIDLAIERIAARDYGLTWLLDHPFGPIPLAASHIRNDTGHTVAMWTYDADGLLAAAEATAPHVGGAPTGRIVTFRAGHLTFAALDTHTTGDATFLAHGQHRYALTAPAGADHWILATDDHTPRRFDTFDDALAHLLTELEHTD